MSVENLSQQEGLLKLKELVDSIDMGMVVTQAADSDFPYMVPMSRQEVDEHGHIWYLISANSETFRHLKNDNRISISFADTASYTFMALNGHAEISQDRARIEKYWNKFIEVYFEKGIDDPSIRVLKVVPDSAHYWDTKSNKLINFLKVATAAVTGAKLDVGREGDLNL